MRKRRKLQQQLRAALADINGLEPPFEGPADFQGAVDPIECAWCDGIGRSKDGCACARCHGHGLVFVPSMRTQDIPSMRIDLEATEDNEVPRWVMPLLYLLVSIPAIAVVMWVCA